MLNAKKNSCFTNLLLAAAVVLLAAPGCSNSGKNLLPERTAFYYECGDKTNFTAKYDKKSDVFWIFGFGDARKLSHLVSASGARYGDGVMTYWGRESSATVEYRGITYNCTENAQKSILEDAKLRGVDFRASGNEPGWVMEITWNKIILYTDYASKKIIFSPGKPENDMRKGTTVYNAYNRFRKMRVLIEDRECFDDMSGYSSGISVEYILDGKTYRGCGRPLH